jgi:hypothetical protein
MDNHEKPTQDQQMYNTSQTTGSKNLKPLLAEP